MCPGQAGPCLAQRRGGECGASGQEGPGPSISVTRPGQPGTHTDTESHRGNRYFAAEVGYCGRRDSLLVKVGCVVILGQCHRDPERAF